VNSKILHLYRGDSLPPCSTAKSNKGRTFAEYFISTGLMAKFADGGSSKLIEKKDIATMTICHIGYKNNSTEQKLSFRSPLISFSESIDIAKNFSTARSKINTPVACAIDEATHFIWELSFEPTKPDAPGIYTLKFKKDSVNLDNLLRDSEREIIDSFNNPNQDLHLLMRRVGNFVMQSTSLVNGNKDLSDNYAKIINAAEFIANSEFPQEYKETAKVAFDRASRDKEWLIFPCNPMPNGYGFSARFPVNKHLKIFQYYKAEMT
jgi:hypothetical protein